MFFSFQSSSLPFLAHCLASLSATAINCQQESVSLASSCTQKNGEPHPLTQTLILPKNSNIVGREGSSHGFLGEKAVEEAKKWAVV